MILQREPGACGQGKARLARQPLAIGTQRLQRVGGEALPTGIVVVVADRVAIVAEISLDAERVFGCV